MDCTYVFIFFGGFMVGLLASYLRNSYSNRARWRL